MTENEIALSNDEIELIKLRKIAGAAYLIVENNWKHHNEDDAKRELKESVHDYETWVIHG